MTIKRIRGAGGGGGGSSHTPVEKANSLASKQIATILDAVSEGPIYGLVNGLQSIFLDETPLQNTDGVPQVANGPLQPTDGSFNYVDVSAQVRLGTQDQLPMDGVPDVEFETPINVEVKRGTPVVRTITTPSIDTLRVTVSVPSLTQQDMSNGDLNGSSVNLTIEVQNNGGGFVKQIDDIISGKVSSKYQRAYMIKLPGTGPWDVRVTRLTPDATNSATQNRLFFDSYTGIISSRLSYPNTALVGMRIDSSQFSSIPSRAYDMKGLIVSVPTNYDPITRTYSGLWNGTFKQDWTDNPAWCFYDLLTTARYGLGDLIEPHSVDKWALYSIAQFCDQLVPNGFGGQEPRFTCNLYLQAREEAYKVLQNFASIFRAIAFWSAGSVVTMQDRPADATALYTNGNVIDGAFNYSGSSLKQRHTVALVSWNDPQDFFRQKIEYVQDDDGVRQFGVIQSDVTAFGCTSRGQAHRLGRWMLMTEKFATETVSFKAGLDGFALYPGAIIKTSDLARAGTRMGGRLDLSDKSRVTLDADATIAAGETYSISVVTEDGSLQTRPVVNPPGTYRTLTLATPLTANPLPSAVYILTASNLTPEEWRVVGATESGNGEVTVSAIAHYSGLFDAIELNAPFADTPHSSIKNKPDAPTNLSVVVSQYQITGDVVGLKGLFSWSATAGKYIASWRRANGAWQSRTVYEPMIEIDNLDYDTYNFAVYAISAIGRESDIATLTQAITPTPIVLPNVTGLVMEGAFTSTSAKFAWNAVAGATSYEVQMVVGSPSRVSRTVNVGNALRFDYSAGDMRADGGPWRVTTIRVRAHGKFNSVSANWTELTASNPQITLLQGIQIDAGIRAAYFQCAPPLDDDFAGIMVWVGTTANFVANDAALVYDGPTCFATIANLADGTQLVAGTYYLRAAGYDAFGKDSLNVSPSIAFQVSANAPDADTISSGMIKDGALNVAKFAAGIEPVSVIANLNPALFAGTKAVFNQADGKLYRWNGSAYTKEITVGDLAADSVTAGTVSAGAINTRELAAGAVTANKMTIGDFSNLSENGDFSLGDVGWQKVAGWSVSATSGMNGAGQATCNAYIPSPLRNNFRVKATVGDTFYAQCYVWLNNRSESCYVRIAGYSATGVETILAQGNNANVGDPGWLVSSVSATIPPNIVTVRVEVVATAPSGVAVSACGLFRMSGATLIQDGAITTNKVAAAAITGDKIVGNTITGDKIIANTITGDKIQAGSVSANVLTSGIGSGNLAYNAAFTATYSSGSNNPADGWSSSSYLIADPINISVNFAGPSWNPPGSNCLTVMQAGSSAPGGYAEVGSVNMTVTEGVWHEFSVYSGAHRCNLDMFVYWCDANGTPFANSGFIPAAKNYQEASGGTSLTGYKRLFMIAQAPAGAVTARLMLRKSGTQTGTNSYAFWCQPYFGTATGPNQSQPSAWSPPGIGTQIHGGAIKTSTITADRLAVTSLSAITANIGLLRSATSGARFELSSNGLVVYDVNGVDRVTVGYIP